MPKSIKNRKVFFGCSMKGGREKVDLKNLAKFPAMIEKLGCKLMSKHQIRINIIEREDSLTKTKIHDRDYKWLTEADVGIFEISNASLGVGAEISDAINLKKPVLCLYKRTLKNEISAYILGKEGSKYLKPLANCYGHETLYDAENIIKDFIKQVRIIK